MNRWIVVAFLVLIVIVIAYITGSNLLKPEMKLTQEQAVALATDELRYAYRNATVEIYGMENVSNTTGENLWKIEAKVVYGASTTCPNLILVELRYPKFGFVTRERIITENCRVLGCRNVPNCVIAYPEEAILMPFDPDRNQGLQADINSFTSAAGRDSIAATADFHPDFTSPADMNYKDVWVVRYASPNLNYSFETILNKTGGNALEHYLVNKTA